MEAALCNCFKQEMTYQNAQMDRKIATLELKQRLEDVTPVAVAIMVEHNPDKADLLHCLFHHSFLH